MEANSTGGQGSRRAVAPSDQVMMMMMTDIYVYFRVLWSRDKVVSLIWVAAQKG